MKESSRDNKSDRDRVYIGVFTSSRTIRTTGARRWADEIAETRRRIFTSVSLTQHLPALLARQRTEIDRLRAARDAKGLEYQIRNYFRTRSPYAVTCPHESRRQNEAGREMIPALASGQKKFY